MGIEGDDGRTHSSRHGAECQTWCLVIYRGRRETFTNTQRGSNKYEAHFTEEESSSERHLAKAHTGGTWRGLDLDP